MLKYNKKYCYGNRNDLISFYMKTINKSYANYYNEFVTQTPLNTNANNYTGKCGALGTSKPPTTM